MPTHEQLRRIFAFFSPETPPRAEEERKCVSPVTVQRVGGEFKSPGPPHRGRVSVFGQPRLLIHVLSWVNRTAPRLRTHPRAAKFREHCTVLLAQRFL